MLLKKEELARQAKLQQPILAQKKKVTFDPNAKILTSQLIKNHQAQQKTLKNVKSQPNIKIIEQVKEKKQQSMKKQKTQPRFMRTSKQLLNKMKVTFKYLSPPAKNILVHQPPKPPKVQIQQQKPYKTIVTPPSQINRDKMKNFQQNPEAFLTNLDEGLSKVFKKSVQSIIRDAKVIPVKDWQIRDSTDLLDGYTGND